MTCFVAALLWKGSLGIMEAQASSCSPKAPCSLGEQQVTGDLTACAMDFACKAELRQKSKTSEGARKGWQVSRMHASI